MLRPLELLYLLAGFGIIGHGVVTDSLTPTELGAALFFLTLVPVTRADRKAREGDNPLGSLRRALIKWLADEKPTR